MTTTELVSPPAVRVGQPRWLDPRLVAGVLCIVVSVLLAAQVLSSADRSVRVWALTRDLPAGTELTADDLGATRVRLFGDDAARYLDAGRDAPAGRVLARGLGAGDLLPASALVPVGDVAPRRLVTVPVEREHALGGALSRGDLVDIIATVRETGRPAVTAPVLKGVLVVDVVRPSGGLGGSSEFAIVVSVRPEDALSLTAAIRVAQLDVIKVVGAGGQAGDVGSGSVTSGAQPGASAVRR